MFSFKFANLKARGSIFVLFALLLPVMLLFFILAVDFGLLYSERTKLQGIADAAALAGATERYQKPNASIPLPSLSSHENIDGRITASGRVIAARVWEYLLLNGQELATCAEGDTKSNCREIAPDIKDSNYVAYKDRSSDSDIKDISIGEGLAFQFTNFTNDDNNVQSIDTSITGSTNIMENYTSLVSNYRKDKYNGPEIADVPENIGKIAVQCGVPVDNKDRVRVRLRKIVPTIFLQLFYSGYDNGVPVTVVAAAQTRKPLSAFRLVGLHGIWLSYTAIPNNNDKSYPFDPSKYLEGDVYCGDNLAITWGGNDIPRNKTEGYHPNLLTVKGRIFARYFSNGTFNKRSGSQLASNTNADNINKDYDLFYKLPDKDGNRENSEYLYMRYNPEKRTMEYATESTLDARYNANESKNEGWYHVYNFNRMVTFERVKVWNEELQRYLPFPPHLMRIGLAPEKDREDFLAATKSALSLRQTYRMNLNSIYKEAIRALGPERKNTDTMWRYLKATTKVKSVMGTEYCSIKPSDAGKSIKLLVEIDGVRTDEIHADGYDNKNALAFLHKYNTPKDLNIEQMVVVIKDGADDNTILNAGNSDYNIYHNGPLYNHNSTLRMQTGALMIEDVRPGIKFGDIYSEANICIVGHKDSGTLTFNGILFSEKNLCVPHGAKEHNFTGSCSMFGNRVIMGYSYGNVQNTDNKPTDTRNYTCADLTAGLDYPTNVIMRKRNSFSTNVSKHNPIDTFMPTKESDVPMHYSLVGLTDEEYHAEVFEGEAQEGFNDDQNPADLKLKHYDKNYNYHWFNPNMKMVYYPIRKSDSIIKADNKRYVHKFASGNYGLQKIGGVADVIGASDYFDIYNNTNSDPQYLLDDLKDLSVDIADSEKGLVKQEELYKLRNHCHIAPSSSGATDDYEYGKHIMAFMPEETGGDEMNPKGTLTTYYIKSDYPYVGGHYSLDGTNKQLFSVPADTGESILQLFGPALVRHNTGRVFADLLYTPYKSSLAGAPWSHIGNYKDNNNTEFSIPSVVLGRTDYIDASTKIYPWYYWLSGIANGRSDTDYHVNLLDANRIYLNFWKRAALYGGPEYANTLANPFAYCPPGPQRDKILAMIQGLATDTPAIPCNNTTATARAQREGYIYRFTVDLDMHIAYRIDDYVRFNCTKLDKFAVSDSFGPRLFDEATENEGVFGTYPSREKPSNPPYHTFGVPDDSIYSSIGLVE